MSESLQNIDQMLSTCPMCFLATINGNEPRVRAFQYQLEQDGKLWFCTARSKDVFKQLQATPTVEICAVNGNISWVRVNGKVTLEDNHSVKERILSEQPLIKSIYGSADNPDFTTFYLEHGNYTITDFSENPASGGAF